MMISMISVAMGGAIGALLRYATSLYVSTIGAGLPAYFATVSVNVIGCALMGVMAALLPMMPALQGTPRHFIMIGFLGALTTFSSFAFDSLVLFEKQDYVTLTAYFFGSVFFSFAAFFSCYHVTKLGLS